MTRTATPSLTTVLFMAAMPSLVGGCRAHPAAAPAVVVAPAPAPATAVPEPAAGARVLATVNGEPIDEAAVEAHGGEWGIGPEEAFEDLIDMRLLRAAAAKASVAIPEGRWGDTAERHRVEYKVARSLSMELLPEGFSLRVDHAWVKDAATPRQQAANLAVLKKLRALALAGTAINDAFEQQKLADVQLWHIGYHENYPYKTVPAAARDLPPGTVSTIIPGDGGLHLFQILDREKEPPYSDSFVPALRARLRQEARIVRTPRP